MSYGENTRARPAVTVETVERFAREVTGPRDLIDVAFAALVEQLTEADRLRQRDLHLETAVKLLPPGAPWTVARAINAALGVAAETLPEAGEDPLVAICREVLRLDGKVLGERQIFNIIKARSR